MPPVPITEIRARHVRVPLERPVGYGDTTITFREYALVTVAAGGALGVGYSFTRGAPLASVIRDQLTPHLIGHDAFDAHLAADLLRSGTALLGRRGSYPRAVSVLDVALWDLRGKLAGASVSGLLGIRRNRIPAIAAAGYYRAGQTAEDVYAEFATLRQQGFGAFKVMVGGADLRTDLTRLAAARRAVGPQAVLAIDACCSLPDVATAVELWRHASDHGVAFLEDPFLPDEEEAINRLRDQGARLALGETESGQAFFRRLVKRGLVDVVRVDATVVGGITEMAAVDQLAEEHGRPVVPHYFPEIHSHLAAAHEVVNWVEIVPIESGAENLHRIAQFAGRFEAGAIVLSAEPGLGLDWRWDEVDRWSVH